MMHWGQVRRRVYGKVTYIYRHKVRHGAYVAWDRLARSDYATWAEPEELGLDPARSNRYTPSGFRFLRSALDQLSIDAGDRILDVGCGKGHAMRTLLRYPFARVDGLELSPELAAIAHRNLRRHHSRSRIYVGDAGDFGAAYTEYNWFYLYNPFPEIVVRVFLSELDVDLHPREIFIIYCNPIHSDLLLEKGFARTTLIPNRGHGEIAVFGLPG